MTKKDWKALCYDPLCEIHNPATESTQPKPTEWTVEVIEGMHRASCGDDEFYRDIADTHNAALAATMQRNGALGAEKVELLNQLRIAGERALLQAIQADSVIDKLNEKLTQAEAALAAEREKVTLTSIINRDTIEVVQLKDQLAAEREKVQTLVDALKSYEYDSNGTIVVCLGEAAHKDALAKVKEGK